MQSNAGVRDRDRAAQKAAEGNDRQTDRQTDTVCLLYDDDVSLLAVWNKLGLQILTINR